jgi:hypothetical protein
VDSNRPKDSKDSAVFEDVEFYNSDVDDDLSDDEFLLVSLRIFDSRSMFNARVIHI